MKMLRLLTLACLLLSLISQSTSAAGQDWHRWRGPDLNGISKETGWTTTWPAEGPKRLWKASVGIGFSSISVANGRAYTMGNASDKDTVFCFAAATGETSWKYTGPKASMYDVEHKELFDSIRTGKPINNGEYGTLSRALGIMAQVACYTGGMVTWDELMRSRRTFDLPRYGWDVEAPVRPGPDGRYPTAMQGPAERKLWLM